MGQTLLWKETALNLSIQDHLYGCDICTIKKNLYVEDNNLFGLFIKIYLGH